MRARRGVQIGPCRARQHPALRCSAGMSVSRGPQLKPRKPTAILPSDGRRRSSFSAAGVSEAEFRHAHFQGEAVRLAHGIYVRREDLQAPDSAAWEFMRAVTRGTEYVVGGRTAALLWGLCDGTLSPPFEIFGPPRGSRIRRGSVEFHRVDIPREFIVQLAGLRVASPAWAWAEAALRGPVEDAVVMADRALSASRMAAGSLVRPEDLAEAVEARGRTPGIGTAREALVLARPGVDSDPETRLRLRLVRAGLPAPVVNPLVADSSGRRRFRPDLAFEEFRVAVQYEGVLVHSDDQRVLKDIRRAEAAEALGWVEVRISRDHMQGNGSAAVEKVAKALRARGWQGRLR